jgi:hypothetical protein
MTEDTRPSGQRPVRDLARSNRAQNKQLKDAARDEGLNNEQRRRLGEIIEHESRREGIAHDYHTIRRVARDIKEGRL